MAHCSLPLMYFCGVKLLVSFCGDSPGHSEGGAASDVLLWDLSHGGGYKNTFGEYFLISFKRIAFSVLLWGFSHVVFQRVASF